jgi:acetyl esterase/lipase
MKKILFSFSIILASTMSKAQEVLKLYPESIPNSKPFPDKETSEIDSTSHILIIGHVSRPTLAVFLPPKSKATGTAVLIVPGGGYYIVAAGHEGYDVAKKFNEAGIAAFVLKYRIPDNRTMVNKEIGPLQDAERAMQTIRERAKEWAIDPNRIGIMGFSAGGHIASTEATHYKKVVIVNKKNTNLRPDFMVLVYPVISFSDSIGHLGSRIGLLGKTPSKEKIREYSNELQVNPQTPPCFLIHAKNDNVVPVKNSLVFYEALQKNNVPAKLYLYDKGGHGFGLHNETSDVQWIDLVIPWIKQLDLKH